MAHIHASTTPAFDPPANTDRATQTAIETRPSLPQDTVSLEARRHVPGGHPLASRIGLDGVTGSGVRQARQTIHPHLRSDRGDGRGDAGIQTDHVDSVRQQSLDNVRGMFRGVDNQTAIGLAQDIDMSRRIAEAGEMPSPPGALASDCICLPPDLMAYRVATADGGYKLRYNCPEINGTGFGGIRDMHPAQLEEVMRTVERAGQEIAARARADGEVPLVVVANSGREGAQRTDGAYPPSSNSKMIWEKMFVADRMAGAFASEHHDVFVESLDAHVGDYHKAIDAINADASLSPAESKQRKEQAYQDACGRMAAHKDRPLVLLGYSVDMAACCRIENGRPTLFGRPLNGPYNDRGLQNLALVQDKSFDYHTFHPMNVTVKEAVDKFEAAKSRAAFLASDDFSKLGAIAEARGFRFDPLGVEQVRHFPRGAAEPAELAGKDDFEKAELRSTYFRGLQEHEGNAGVLAAWDDFARVGLKPLFKPNGTGQSKGIIAARKNETREQFLQRFEDNRAEIARLFGKGAGYPFMVMPLLKLDETAANEAYDLRFATYQNVDDKQQGKIRSVPLILKKEPPKAGPSAASELEFSPTNVTAAVAKTGKKGSDFIVSLCSSEGLKQSHLSEDNMKSISLYFAAYQAWLLKNTYPRGAAS